MTRSTLLLTTAALAATACGGGSYADVTGTVSGYSPSPNAYYFGGPFLVLVSEPLDCMDAFWVKRTYVDGDDAPFDKDLIALQFTYNEGDVIAGQYSVEGQAPVNADMVVIEGGALQVFSARTGSLLVDEVKDDKFATGNFQLGFDEGNLSGEFEVEFCTNLKTKD